MPPIRSISFSDNTLKITDNQGEHTFNSSNIPDGINTKESLEQYLNDTWLPSITNGEYQIKVHVFSLLPLHLANYCADIGNNIPDNWWEE